MPSVFDRVRKLAPSSSLQERLTIPYAAILNLTDVEEIKEFTLEYLKMYETTGKTDIPYMLSFMDYTDRLLWHKAVGNIINFDVYYNRPESELDRFFEYVDGSGKALDVYYNEEKGQHQDVLAVGTKIIKVKRETQSS